MLWLCPHNTAQPGMHPSPSALSFSLHLRESKLNVIPVCAGQVLAGGPRHPLINACTDCMAMLGGCGKGVGRCSDTPGKYPSRWDLRMGRLGKTHPSRGCLISISLSLGPQGLKAENKTQRNNTKSIKARKASASPKTKQKKKNQKEKKGGETSSALTAALFELHWWHSLTFPRLSTQALAPVVRPSASLFCWDCFHAEGRERDGKGFHENRLELPPSLPAPPLTQREGGEGEWRTPTPLCCFPVAANSCTTQRSPNSPHPACRDVWGRSGWEDLTWLSRNTSYQKQTSQRRKTPCLR